MRLWFSGRLLLLYHTSQYMPFRKGPSVNYKTPTDVIKQGKKKFYMTGDSSTSLLLTRLQRCLFSMCNINTAKKQGAIVAKHYTWIFYLPEIFHGRKASKSWRVPSRQLSIQEKLGHDFGVIVHVGTHHPVSHCKTQSIFTIFYSLFIRATSSLNLHPSMDFYFLQYSVFIRK